MNAYEKIVDECMKSRKSESEKEWFKEKLERAKMLDIKVIEEYRGLFDDCKCEWVRRREGL